MTIEELEAQYHVGSALRHSSFGLESMCDRLDMLFKVLIEILREIKKERP